MQLRPWPAVVNIFNYENNEEITESYARTVCTRALDKILNALVKDPESRELVQEHLRPSEFNALKTPFDEVKEYDSD